MHVFLAPRWMQVGLLLVLFCAACSNSNTPSVTTPPEPTVPISEVDAQAQRIAQGAHDTVKSRDGNVELLIPAGALPNGVTSVQIQITALDSANASVKQADKTPRFAYQLEPDGLQFSQPAVIRITTALAPGDNVPVTYLISKGTVAALDTAVSMNPAAQQATVSALVTHFSIVAGFDGRFQVSLSEVGTHYVGESFVATAIVTRVSRTTAFSEPITRLNMAQEWFLAGYWIAGINPPITPEFVRSAPPRTQLSIEEFTVRQTFTCIRVGSTVIRYNAYLEFQDTVEATGASSLAHDWIEATVPVDCISTADATKTGVVQNVPPTNTPANVPSPTKEPTNTPANVPSPSKQPTNTPPNAPPATTLPTNTPANAPSATTLPTNTPANAPSATTLPTNTPANAPSATTLPTNTPATAPTHTSMPSPTPAKTATLTATSTTVPTKVPTKPTTPTATPKTLGLFWLKAEFHAEERSTYYIAEAVGDGVTYEWSLQNTERDGRPCGTFAKNLPTANQAVWHHPDEPGGCPEEPVHPATITVILRDIHGAMLTCVYNRGSAPGFSLDDPTSTNCFK